MNAAEEAPIERLRVSILSAPIDDIVPMSFGQLGDRKACLIEIDAGGLCGVGESWINYPAWGHRERLATLCDGVGPVLMGLNALDPEGVMRTLTEKLLPIGRQWGAPGPVWQAISGVDIALWDLAGKAAGLSVARMLHETGQPRYWIPAYASGVGPTDVTRLCENAMSEGFRAVKAKVGFGEERDLKTLSDARTAIGTESDLFADANQAWSLAEAKRMCAAFAKHEVAWLEEPLAGDHLEELEKLAAGTDMPLASGENVYGFEQFCRYIESNALRLVQPDLAKSGGFTLSQQIASKAATGRTRIAPHCYSGAVSLVASLQLGAAHECVEWLELDVRSNPLRTDLLDTPLEWSDGALGLPDRPGLGIELNQATVRRFRTHLEERTHRDI